MFAIKKFFGCENPQPTAQVASVAVAPPADLEKEWNIVGDVKPRTYYVRVYDQANLRELSISCYGEDYQFEHFTQYPDIMKVGRIYFVTIKHLLPGFSMTIQARSGTMKKVASLEDVDVDRGFFLPLLGVTKLQLSSSTKSILIQRILYRAL